MSNTFLNKGELVRAGGKDEKPDFSFPSSKDFFSLPANLIPAISGVSGGRVLLGSKATLQAVSLVDREPPLVQSVARHNQESFVNQIGKELLSIKAKEDGTVINVDSDDITIKDNKGQTHRYELYNNYNLGRKTYISHYPAVKVGDKVSRNQIIATSNYTDSKGALALGINLRTDVMPYRSGNFEDAWVVTESGAKKLDAEQIIRVRVEKKMGVEVDKRKYISIFANKFISKQLEHIDEDGVVKKGTILHAGDPIILAMSPKALKSTDIALGKLSKVLKNAYKDNAETWDLEAPGEVVDVSKTDSMVTVNIKTRRSLSVGDKLSNAWGAKGVVGAIIPDTQAPTDKDGKPVDIMLNSMSITSRVAPALAVTLGMGKYAEKLGRPIKIAHFTKESSVQKAIDTLKKNDIPDKEQLYDPVSGKHISVTTGPLYFTRLIHIAEDKESSRSQGMGYSWDMQPTKSEGESAKRVGNLATSALLSHGATAVLKDLGTIKSTKNDEYWNRLKLGLPLPSPKVPFIFDKFVSSLQGAGIKVDKKGDTFNILPMTDKDVLNISAGPINKAGTFKTRDEKAVPEAGGLFDPSKVGVLGDRYNHVELNFPVPNPISEDYLRKLVGVTKTEYEKLIIRNELKDKLAAINLDQKLAEYEKYLKSGKKTDRSNALKLVVFLKTLKKHGLHPKDLMLTKIPIVPAQFRPMQVAGDQVISASVNHLYKDLINNNNSFKDLTGVPEHAQELLKKQQYGAVKAIFGLGDPITTKNLEKGYKGLLATTIGTRGGSGKMTMFQARVVNKPLDLVGRSVLTPDAKLELDEASVPQDILWKTYSPFVIRRMVMRGVPALKARDYLQNRNPLAVQALLDELKSRPAIVSRDPSLHKFNLTGFFLKPNPDPKDKTIKLNPLVFKSFNADNDGDQLNINVPASDEARLEIIEKMLPSKNLLSPKTFGPMYVPGNEAALGLFQMSTEDNKNEPKKYKTEEDVIKDFQAGKLDVGDRVEIG